MQIYNIHIWYLRIHIYPLYIIYIITYVLGHYQDYKVHGIKNHHFVSDI